MKHAMKLAALQIMAVLVTATSVPHAAGLPEDPLILLSEAAEDPCSICAGKKREQAFRALDECFVPGREISSSGTCRMVKSDRGNALVLTCYPSDSLQSSFDHAGALPQVVFAIYTSQDRLVGIPESGYTEKSVYDLFRASPAGTVFEGSIRLIGYPYGDGLVFNYFPKTHVLQFHCVAVELKPVAAP